MGRIGTGLLRDAKGESMWLAIKGTPRDLSCLPQKRRERGCAHLKEEEEGNVDDNDVFELRSARQLAQAEKGSSPVKLSVNDGKDEPPSSALCEFACSVQQGRKWIKRKEVEYGRR